MLLSVDFLLIDFVLKGKKNSWQIWDWGSFWLGCK